MRIKCGFINILLMNFHGNRPCSLAGALLLPCCQVQSKERAFSFRDDTYSQGELYQMFQEILGVSALDHQMFAAKKQVCGVGVWGGKVWEAGVGVGERRCGRWEWEWEREGVGGGSGSGREKVWEAGVGERRCGRREWEWEREGVGGGSGSGREKVWEAGVGVGEGRCGSVGRGEVEWGVWYPLLQCGLCW